MADLLVRVALAIVLLCTRLVKCYLPGSTIRTKKISFVQVNLQPGTRELNNFYLP